MSFYSRLGASAAQAAAAKPSTSSVSDPVVKQAFAKELAQKYEMPDGTIVKGQLQANLYAQKMLEDEAKKQALEDQKITQSNMQQAYTPMSWWSETMVAPIPNWALIAGVGVVVLGGGVWWMKSKKSSVAGYRRRRSRR